MTTNDQMRALCEAARKSVANMYEAVYSVSDHVSNDALKDADDAKETLAEFFSTALTQLSEQAARVKVLEENLQEAVDLMEDVRTGEYKPDSFTTQPWREALKGAAK